MQGTLSVSLWRSGLIKPKGLVTYGEEREQRIPCSSA